MRPRLFHHIATACLSLLLVIVPLTLRGTNKGIPFIRSFTADEYNAHNRNFDITSDEYGTVFVANFEGLLYYDGSTWRKIHTPGISRVTRIAKGPDGRIWVGGFNVFGYLYADAAGRLHLRTLVSDAGRNFFGEVDMIKVSGRELYIHTSSNAFYRLGSKDRLQRISNTTGMAVARDYEKVNNISLPGMSVSAVPADGIAITLPGRTLRITEEDGLCNNSVNFLSHDKRHMLWGATDHGVFAMEVPSPFSRLTEAQGLHGEVYSIGMIGTTVYFGTLQGLYRYDNGIIRQIPDINLACWQILPLDGSTLLAATASGLYRITAGGVRKMTEGNTLSVCKGRGSMFYTGEVDGVYEVQKDGTAKLLAKIEKCTKVRNAGDKLRVETLYGEQWEITLGSSASSHHIKRVAGKSDPKIDYMDANGRHWITDTEGKNIKVTINDKTDRRLTTWANAISDRTLNAIYVNKDNSVWVGGDFGAINLDISAVNNGGVKMHKEYLYIRQVVTMNDSVLWGGYSRNGCKPLKAVKGIELPSSCNSITVYFSAGSMSVFHPTMYRYRLNGGRWSAWSEDTYVRFGNMQYGNARLEVQSLDLFGNISNTASVEWYLNYPFYLRWWAILVYAAIIGLAVRAVVLYRMKKLRRDKQMLEETVNERTAELSTALDDLQRMQADLMRMERTATAGKLTQGLIDRILNPINYINNFSKLTSGLAKDLKEDIDDEKENMAADNYDDCLDIIGMMQTNLSKIEEHGVNTTRTLRAMEAMLKNQIGNVSSNDMTKICCQAMEMAAEYHKESISRCRITMKCDVPKTPLMHDVDADSMNKALIAILNNAIYAVVKKYQRTEYDAEVTLKLSTVGAEHLDILIHDNGIGIEDTIINKVFDPFFTTKPTSEAAGVGLYLAREIVQDHNGTITLRTEKDVYTDFVISL